MGRRALGSIRRSTEANTKPINVRNLLTEQMFRSPGLRNKSINTKGGLTLPACPKVQDKAQRPQRSPLVSAGWGKGVSLEMGQGAQGSLRPCGEGKKHGFKPSLCPAGCVIFSKTADLCESASSLKIKTVKPEAAAASQSYED